ncbi:unnamed protein product [Acanthoscelides obtectus]|uniref:Major facilitator superfamily (MFS) profile domain-containing protein n=1 Tax=Acanthoscelides obtectus TaxID=200917 RepID=A0A9P0KBC3_ACAOB|nr:unnamed protein product [Acanthoscelides obtectus]CAK1648482.1 Facilitated trehalose transporter Tret1 [Acanthoscelides obtectus]
MTWTSPIYPKLHSNDSTINPIGREITRDEDGWIGSLVNVGAMFGPLPFSFVSERFGRKIGLLSIAIPHIIAFMTMAFAESVYLFYLGRLLGGIAVGGGYTLLPMYIAEVSEAANRGAYSSTLGIFWAFGNFIPNAIGPFMSVMWFNLLLTCFPVAFFITFYFLGKETPYFLVGANKIDEAEEVLMKLRCLDNKGVEIELNQIKTNLKKEESGSYSDILKNAGLRKAFVISLILMALQQLCGMNAVNYYLQTILQESGSKLPSDISSLIVGFGMFLFSFLVPPVMDRLGRKVLLALSCTGMGLSMFILGSYFYIKDHTSWSVEPIYWLPLLSLVFLIFSYQMGVSIVPWAISSELFPKNVKQVTSTAVSTTACVSTFLVTRFFNNMTESLGAAGTFWFFSCCCSICLVFTCCCVPETKGKSYEEIQNMVQKWSKSKESNEV